jgi:hypothetical protein
MTICRTKLEGTPPLYKSNTSCIVTIVLGLHVHSRILTALYTRYAPHKLQDIESLLQDFIGRVRL